MLNVPIRASHLLYRNQSNPRAVDKVADSEVLPPPIPCLSTLPNVFPSDDPSDLHEISIPARINTRKEQQRNDSLLHRQFPHAKSRRTTRSTKKSLQTPHLKICDAKHQQKKLEDSASSKSPQWSYSVTKQFWEQKDAIPIANTPVQSKQVEERLPSTNPEKDLPDFTRKVVINAAKQHELADLNKIPEFCQPKNAEAGGQWPARRSTLPETCSIPKLPRLPSYLVLCNSNSPPPTNFHPMSMTFTKCSNAEGNHSFTSTSEPSSSTACMSRAAHTLSRNQSRTSEHFGGRATDSKSMQLTPVKKMLSNLSKNLVSRIRSSSSRKSETSKPKSQNFKFTSRSSSSTSSPCELSSNTPKQQKRKRLSSSGAEFARKSWSLVNNLFKGAEDIEKKEGNIIQITLNRNPKTESFGFTAKYKSIEQTFNLEEKQDRDAKRQKINGEKGLFITKIDKKSCSNELMRIYGENAQIISIINSSSSKSDLTSSKNLLNIALHTKESQENINVSKLEQQLAKLTQITLFIRTHHKVFL